MEQPSHEELLRVWQQHQQAKERKARYTQSEAGKAAGRAKAKKYYEAHKDEIAAKRKEYYEANKDRLNDFYKQRYHRIKEKKSEV